MTIILISIGSIFFKVEVKLVKSIQCKPSPVIIFFLFFLPIFIKKQKQNKTKNYFMLYTTEMFLISFVGKK